jgi:hypothetical protein
MSFSTAREPGVVVVHFLLLDRLGGKRELPGVFFLIPAISLTAKLSKSKL